jgi:hypothetical protein
MSGGWGHLPWGHFPWGHSLPGAEPQPWESHPRTMRAVFDGLLPDGPAFKAQLDSDMDRLFDAIGGDIPEAVRVELGKLAFIRDPRKTNVLTDLEYECGIITTDSISEDERREYCAAVKYARPGHGADIDLESRLRNAGFDVRVYRNDPVIDPSVYASRDFAACCGNENSCCGNETAFIGRFTSELIINGDSYTLETVFEACCGNENTCCGNELAVCGIYTQERVLVAEYTLPDGSDTWRYVFFIGGEATGHEMLNDWNMELPHLYYWPKGETSLAYKVRGPKAAGLRALAVEAVDNTDEQNVVPVQPDPSLVLAMRMWNDAGTEDFYAFNMAWKNVFGDGGMSDLEDTPWVGVGSSDIEIANSVMTITYGGTEPAGAQQIGVMVAGRYYRVCGRTRGDGISSPILRTYFGSPIWVGTNSTDWQDFDFTFLCEGVGTNPGIFLSSDITSATSDGYVEYDNFAAYELAYLQDPEMNAPTVVDWSASAAATLSKTSVVKYSGAYALEVESTGAGDAFASKDCLRDTAAYRVQGWVKSDGDTVPVVRFGSVDVWVGTASTPWQYFDFYAVTDSDTLSLGFVASVSAEKVWVDSLVISPVLEDECPASLAENDMTPYGEAQLFTGESETQAFINCGEPDKLSRNHNMTVRLVFKATDVTGTGTVILFREDGLHIAVEEDGADYMLRCYDGAAINRLSGFEITPDKTYDLVFVFMFLDDAIEVSFYSNGVLVAEFPLVNQLDTRDNLYIGGEEVLA